MKPADFNAAEIVAGRITWSHMVTLKAFAPSATTLEAQVEAWQRAHGLDPDGRAGRRTTASLDATGASIPAPATSVGSGAEVAPWAAWAHPGGPARPHGRQAVIDTFGDPTGGGKYTETEKPDPAWKKAETVELHGASAFLPAFATRYTSVHRLVEPTMREAFRRAEISCPGYAKTAGVLVFRHERHDPKRPLSLHSWGIAVDVNADDNAAAHPSEFFGGKIPEPWTPAWWARWPRGMPKNFVLAFESCGFIWGGRWPSFADPMHLQLCS